MLTIVEGPEILRNSHSKEFNTPSSQSQREPRTAVKMVGR